MNFSQKLVKHFYQDTNLQLAAICRFATMLSQLSHMQSHETGNHIKRVSEYTRILCAASGMDDEAAKVSMASMMHDIGKLDVPQSILEKPGKLTPDEFEIIKTHVTAGHKLLAGSPGELLQISAKIALEHHERWDGTGYLHMAGDEISLYAGCVAIADVFEFFSPPDLISGLGLRKTSGQKYFPREENNSILVLWISLKSISMNS